MAPYSPQLPVARSQPWGLTSAWTSDEHYRPKQLTLPTFAPIAPCAWFWLWLLIPTYGIVRTCDPVAIRPRSPFRIPS